LHLMLFYDQVNDPGSDFCKCGVFSGQI